MPKNVVLLLIIFLVIACNNKNRNQTESIKKDSTTLIPDFNIALQFINDYSSFCSRQISSHSDTTDAFWISKNQMLTNHFKTTYKNLLDSAEKADPELGLDFDPVFDAQDFPDNGFKILNRDTANGYVTVLGNDLNNFKLVLKVVRQNNKWLVDGSGVVNIPENKRAKR